MFKNRKSNLDNRQSDNNLFDIPDLSAFKMNQLFRRRFIIASYDEDSDPPITASLGSSVALPCNITPPTTQDALLLLLFYRNESNQPLYTLDSRETSILSNATFYYAEETVLTSLSKDEKSTQFTTSSSNLIPMTSSKRGTNNRRYEFQLKSPISYMHIKQLNSADAGTYRCRLDFRHSRTINRLMRLYITEPISAVQILSSGQLIEQSAGPFNEDVYTNFTCKAVGGNPPAKIRWIIEENNRARHQRLDIKLIEPNIIKEINGSTNSTINVKLTRTFYGQRLTCEAENESNKLHHTILIDLNLKPDKIQVQSEQIGPLKAGDKARYHCTASGGSSRFSVSWWKSELKEDRLALLNESLRSHFFAKISDNEVLEFQVSPEDHGKVLKCRVKMNSLDAFELTEHVAIQVMFKPIVSLVMGASANSQQLLEGTDLFFECNVQANPSADKVSWLFNGHPLEHSRDRVNAMRNQRKKLTKQTKQQESPDYQLTTDHKKNRNQLIRLNRTSQQGIKQRSRKELMNEHKIERITFRNEDHSLMSISSANRQQNGIYECMTSNSVGSTHSEPVVLDIKYTSTCETDHLYRTIRDIKQQTTKNIILKCPLVPGNPVEQSVCWFLANQSSVEYCDELNSNQTFTLFDLLTDASNDLGNSISNNDEENTLLDSKYSADDTGAFMNSIVDKLTEGAELQLLCWSVNAAGSSQERPCTVHVAMSTSPVQLIDCQVYNTTSHSLSVDCELDKQNQWRIEQPILYQLDANDDQTDALLFQLNNNKQPTFELNQLPAGRTLRLTVYAINKKGTSNKLSLRTSTLIPSKWRSADQQKSPLETIKPALYIGCFALFLCLLFALLLTINRVKNRHPKLPSSVDDGGSSNMVKLEQINFGLDNMLSDITNTVQTTSNSALHVSSLDSEHTALNCIELLAHDDVSAINNESSMFMRSCFTNNDYASFGKVDSNVQLVNAICLHYTPSTFNPLQSDIEECSMANLPSLSANCICKHCVE